MAHATAAGTGRTPISERMQVRVVEGPVPIFRSALNPRSFPEFWVAKSPIFQPWTDDFIGHGGWTEQT